MLKIVIVEDESLAAKRLISMVKEEMEEIHVVSILESIEEAVEFFQQNVEVDLIFMDIHLADGSCFAIFDQVSIDKPIIFCTAYDQYALEAFKLYAVDYLLKPIKKEDLSKALQKYLNYFATINKKSPYKKHFLIKIGTIIKMVDVDQIAYFYSQSKITFVIDLEGRKFPMNFTLEQLETMLDPIKFYRANRQFIINRSAIEKMQTYTKSRLKVLCNPKTPEEIIISTEKSRVFKQWLGGNSNQ